MAFHLTKEALKLDLYAAYHLAKQHKSSKRYVEVFERHLDENLQDLCDCLYQRYYKPEPSSCFIVERPKKREVFAAQFRDRVVHHLYFNYTHALFERTFIEDSYSCIKGKGTHYGINRIKQHILSESQNYTRECYAMSLDIRGYFMHIDRNILLNIVDSTIRRMANHRISKISSQTWSDVLDIEFLCYLSKEIILLDPKISCKIAGSPEDWVGLDYNKSLFHTPDGCGLPIGNLTSQLLSNVYMNEFDQFMKRNLRCKHYGRYVDDSFVISCNKQWLHDIIPAIDEFLRNRLKLELHRGKTHIRNVKYGVEFLGGYVKPYRTYMSHAALRRMRHNIDELRNANKDKLFKSINAMLGIMSHYNTFDLRKELFLRDRFLKFGTFDHNLTTYKLK